MALDLDQIRATAQRVAASYGLDVVDIEFTGGSKHRALTVFIERNAEGRARLAAEVQAAAESARREAEDGEGDANIGETEASELPSALLSGLLDVEQTSGVTHENCEQFSQDFGTVIDVEDLIPGAEYTLEVSSPGLDRKLERPADFGRFRGSLVKLQSFQPIAGNRHWQGRLVSAGEGRIALDLTAMKQKRVKGKDKGKKGAPAAPEVVEIDIANIEKANLVPEI